MTSVVRRAPQFTKNAAKRIAAEVYGLSLTAVSLPSERDRNFSCEALPHRLAAAASVPASTSS